MENESKHTKEEINQILHKLFYEDLDIKSNIKEIGKLINDNINQRGILKLKSK